MIDELLAAFGEPIEINGNIVTAARAPISRPAEYGLQYNDRLVKWAFKSDNVAIFWIERGAEFFASNGTEAFRVESEPWNDGVGGCEIMAMPILI